MTKKCTGQNPPSTMSAKPGDLWRGKGKRSPYSTRHYKTNHKTRLALHQWKHDTPDRRCPQMLFSLPEYSEPFTDVEIQVLGESGPPDALHSPRSTPCGGAVGLPFISPIIKPLDKGLGKILNVLCLPCCQAQSCVFSFVPYAHGVTPPCPYCSRNLSNNVWDRLYSTQRDTELWHPLISRHTFKSRLNELKSK